MDGGGIDSYRRRHGGIRVTWAGVRALRVDEPESRVRRRTAAFAAAPARILAAHDAYQKSVAGPQDAVPEECRPAFVEPIVFYGGRYARVRRTTAARRLARPGLITLVLLFAGSIFALCAAVHDLARDAPTYRAFRSPIACMAAEPANPDGPGAFCVVSDGVVEGVSTTWDGASALISLSPSSDESMLDVTQYVLFTPASSGSGCGILTPGGVFAAAGTVAACVAAVAAFVALRVRRRASRPLSLRHRALP